MTEAEFRAFFLLVWNEMADRLKQEVRVEMEDVARNVADRMLRENDLIDRAAEDE